MKFNPKGEYMVFSIDDDKVECLTDGVPYKIYQYLLRFDRKYMYPNKVISKCFIQDMNTQQKSGIMTYSGLMSYLRKGLGIVKIKKRVNKLKNK